jgi:short-subunit dehydrogenase
MTSSLTKSALILGASSDIGRALSKAYAQDGYRLILAARDYRRLEADAIDLRLRCNVEVRMEEFDVLDTPGHGAFIDKLGELPDVAICVIGLLGDQMASQTDSAATDLVMRTNYVGPAVVLGELATRMEQRGSGVLIGVSSVAGDRGRASNYIYGSAKAGFTSFLSGLRNRLFYKGVQVITVKPGFVDTRMTTGMDLPQMLTAQPIEVATAVLSAQRRGLNVVYVRPIWRLIMSIIRLTPESAFKRMKL